MCQCHMHSIMSWTHFATAWGAFDQRVISAVTRSLRTISVISQCDGLDRSKTLSLWEKAQHYKCRLTQKTEFIYRWYGCNFATERAIRSERYMMSLSTNNYGHCLYVTWRKFSQIWIYYDVTFWSYKFVPDRRRNQRHVGRAITVETREHSSCRYILWLRSLESSIRACKYHSIYMYVCTHACIAGAQYVARNDTQPTRGCRPMHLIQYASNGCHWSASRTNIIPGCSFTTGILDVKSMPFRLNIDGAKIFFRHGLNKLAQPDRMRPSRWTYET